MDVDQPDEGIQLDRQDIGLYDFSYDGDDDGGNIKSPDGAIDDESNMSALDLYTDMVINDSEEAALSMAKLKEEKSSFKTQLDAALIEVSKLTKVNETLTKENQVLKSNISVLLKTAKMEIQRKERELSELREMQLDGRRPSGNAFSSRSRKTRRAPKHRQQPGPLRQNGAQHPKSTKAEPTPRAMNRTGDSDSDKEQKPDVRETMFVRRQRAKNQQQSTTSTSQSSKVPQLSSDKPESDGAKRSIEDTLLRLSQQSSQENEILRLETKEEDKVGPLMKYSDGSPLQKTTQSNNVDAFRRTDPKDSGTPKPEDVHSTVLRSEAQREKSDKRYSHHLKDRSRSKSVERATKSRSGERSCTKIYDDRYKQDQRKVQPRSRSRERSSTSKSDAKRLSPGRSSRSRSNDKRSSRSKSSDRMLFESRSSSSISHERRSSRSKSRDRAPHIKSHNKPNDLKQRKEYISQRESSSTSKSARSERDTIVKQPESLAFSKSRTSRENVSKDRRRDRDRRDSRRSSTPIRDSTRKDSQRSKEKQKTLSSVKMPSSRERGQGLARDRMSSIAKESVAKAKAMLNKRTSGYSSPKKSHRSERRRSSKDLCLDGLTEWTRAELSHKETHPREGRKKERAHEGNERKRKHRLSSSFQKESKRHAKKWKAGSNSDDTGKVDIADENHLDVGGTNLCTYEEGHTVLACGMRDSIECTSSKVTVLHTSVSDAYDTTQSDISFLHASGLQVDNGVLKQSTDNAGSGLNKENKEEGELSEGEMASDDEEASRTKKSKQRSSEKKKRRLSKHRHSHHHSKSTESTMHIPKPPKRGKKHKRRRSSDQEAQERKKRPEENMKSDDSIKSETEEDVSAQKSKACENAFPPIPGLDDSDKEKDVSEFTKTPVDNRSTPISESEAEGMRHVSESALGACGDVEEVPKSETLRSPVEEGEHEKVSKVQDESRGERILTFEDAVKSEIIGANLSTEALSEQAISTPIKESVCAGELQVRQGATEADSNVSRGILFEDLCLSSSVDDTSYLSCVNTTSENQRHSFMNSIEKVHDLVKEISDPLVNISALDTDESQQLTEGHEKLETEMSDSLGTSALDLHHIPPKTITSEPMPDPSKNGEEFSELRVKDASPDKMVTDGTHLEKTQRVQDISASLSDTSAELNTSKSSEPAHDDAVHSCEKDVLVSNDDKSESDDHILYEDNDAVSLLAASGVLDSFMHDSAPKVKRDFDLSFDESRGVLKETETIDKTNTSLHLTCEWSNIEFQDSSTKMGAEPDQGSVTVGAPVFDDRCAQDMDYAKDPLGIDLSVLDEEEHEEKDETFKDDKENEIHVGRTVENNIKEKEKSQTYMSNEASKLRPSKIDLLNLENMDTSVSDALTTEEAGVSTDDHQSCEVKVSGASYSTDKRYSPISKANEEHLFSNRVTDDEKVVKKENLVEGTLAHQRKGKDEAHVSCNPIVINDGIESELDFEEEEEDSVYIVDVQPADSCKRKRKQEDDSCKDSEELNQSDSDALDLESKHDPLKTLVSLDKTSAVGESKGHKKTISGKGQSESNRVEHELDWESKPGEQNEVVDHRDLIMKKEDKDEAAGDNVGKILQTEMGEDVFQDREKGTDRDYKENEKLDTKKEEEEKTDGDQQKCEEDSEEEGEILEEEEGEEELVQDSDGRHNRKQLSEKSRTDQRHRRDHQGHSHSHLHRSVHRDPSSGKRERSSDLRKLDVEGKGARGRSGSSDRRSHREAQERDNQKHPRREDRERTRRGRINEEHSPKMKEERREASERRKEEDRKKVLERKREEDRRRLERRKEDERREARRLEEERRQHEERKRARRRDENEKVRSRLHDSEKKREPPRRSKKVSEGRKS